MNDFPWTLFFILFAAGMLGGVAILPYALALNPTTMDTIREKLASSGKSISPMFLVALNTVIQTVVLTGIAVFAGLLAGPQVGLGLPVIQAALLGQPVAGLILGFLPVTILVGICSALVLVGLDRYLFMPRLPEVFRQVSGRIALWKRLLTPLYGGINEEILLRLFVMTGLAWLIGLVWKSPDGSVAVGVLWLANLLAALLFGLGHLPATAGITRLTPLVVTRALVMNGLAGLVLGFLYMTYGLESAMLAHACLDIVMHVIVPELTAAGQSRPQPQTVSS